MTIREATLNDVPAIVRIEQRPEYRSFIGRWTAEKHAQTISDEGSAYFVVESDLGAVVAYAILLLVNSDDRSVELKRIAVDGPGQGVGSRLLRFLFEEVFDRYEAHRLFLDVDETNPRAKALYAKLGFREEGLLREATCREGRFFSMTLMSLLDREYRATLASSSVPKLDA